MFTLKKICSLLAWIWILNYIRIRIRQKGWIRTRIVCGSETLVNGRYSNLNKRNKNDTRKYSKNQCLFDEWGSGPKTGLKVSKFFSVQFFFNVFIKESHFLQTLPVLSQICFYTLDYHFRMNCLSFDFVFPLNFD
jgi:hypothetical protein